MDRQLHKLRRDELLEILLEVEQENEQLTEQNVQLRQQLANREFSIQEAGSLADASLRVSGVLEAAQEAADLYLQNVKRVCDQREAAQNELLDKTTSLCMDLARRTEALCQQAASSSGTKAQAPVLQDKVRAMIDARIEADKEVEVS